MKFRVHTTQRKIIVNAENAAQARKYAMTKLNENELITKIKAVK